MEYKILFACWIVALIFLAYWGNRPFTIDPRSVSLPSTFLSLPLEFRRKALDFAWKLGLEPVSSIPFATLGKKASSALLLVGAMIFIVPIALFGLVNLLMPTDQNATTDGGTMFALLIAYSIPLLLLYNYYSRKKVIAQSEEEDRTKAKLNERLKDLAIAFVHENFQGWIDEMDRMTKSQAQTESHVNGATSFTLFSSDFSLVPSGMPSKKLGVTYLFTNGFISVVSNIVFDLMQTSYSYADASAPVFSISPNDAWSTEEFHYRDVVECNYQPAHNDSDSVKFSDKEFPVDGFLALGLVNGSKKQYATTKNAVSNFLTLAREKVRAAKSS